jgi:DnaJ-class molecular chaperone
VAKNRITILGEDDNEIELPTKWAICGTCDGEGRHSQHLGAHTASEFDEAFGTPEEKEDYFNGFYDKSCEDCDGTGKVKIVDDARLTDEQRAKLHAEVEDDHEYEAMVEAERRFGC